MCECVSVRRIGRLRRKNHERSILVCRPASILGKQYIDAYLLYTYPHTEDVWSYCAPHTRTRIQTKPSTQTCIHACGFLNGHAPNSHINQLLLCCKCNRWKVYIRVYVICASCYIVALFYIYPYYMCIIYHFDERNKERSFSMYLTLPNVFVSFICSNMRSGIYLYSTFVVRVSACNEHTVSPLEMIRLSSLSNFACIACCCCCHCLQSWLLVSLFTGFSWFPISLNQFSAIHGFL